MRGRKVSPLRSEISVLLNALHGGSPAFKKAKKFISSYALPELGDEDILHILELTCWEVIGELGADSYGRGYRKSRETEHLKSRRKALLAMRTLLEDLENDLENCRSTQQKHNVDLTSDEQTLSSTASKLQKSIGAVDKLISAEEAGRPRPAPNTDLFSAEYVRAVRRAWQSITGEEPGIARTLVVDFACELWESVGLPDRGEKRTTRDWLDERFQKIR